MTVLRVVSVFDPEPPSEWAIRQIEVDGSLPVEEFLDSLTDDERTQFAARFRKLLEAKPFTEMATFKSMRRVGNMWEVVSTDYRILGFRDRFVLILTNGFRKRGSKTEPSRIAQCERVRDLYFEMTSQPPTNRRS